MRPVILPFLLHFFFIEHAYSSIFYVSSTGNDANAGTLALPWKTITHAASIAEGGDTVFVKAGLYNEKVIFSRSGISGKPITFQGYKATPGDEPPLLVNNTDPYKPYSSDDMPTFDGGNRSDGVGFNCRNQRYLVIKNFQIQNYAYGFIAGGASQTAGNNVIYNVNIKSAGNTSFSYSGTGILLGSMGTAFSNNNTIVNCLVVNAAAEGIGINGDYNKVTGCKVYCNENTGYAATDYYMVVTGSYNTFRDCYIERALGLSHWGHGYTAKTNATQVIDQGLNLPSIAARHNQFYYCVARNMNESFCVRHRTAQYNLFYHCKAIGSHTGAEGSPGGEGNGIVIRDGASDNLFDGCIAENCNQGIMLVDSNEDGDMGPDPPGHPNHNNKIINSIIYNCYIGVSYSGEGVQSDAGDNTIAGCTFYKTRYLHYAGRSCKNMKYIGNIYYGCLPAAPGGYFKGNTFAGDIVPNGINTYFLQCTFYNIEGGMLGNFIANSKGSIAKDPLFKNPAALDFHLQASSPCIDMVDFPDDIKTDYDSLPRPKGVRSDMGAFEYALTDPVSEDHDIIIYPNPASGVLYIVAPDEDNLITIYDLTGKKVYRSFPAQKKTKIELYHIMNGVYFVHVKNKKYEKIMKLVLTR